MREHAFSLNGIQSTKKRLKLIEYLKAIQI